MARRKYENTKIESRAIYALDGLIVPDDYLDKSFNSMDKELSWDGYIYSYNDKIFSNSTLEDKIPVQIKGHIDEQCKEINKKNIQYPVELVVLKNYFNDRGVLYFRVIMSENKTEIFYNALYPSKIKMLLDEAVRKNNKNHINVVLTRMKKSPDEMRRICRQFSLETRKQGSGLGQIVPKSVKLEKLNTINKIQATAIATYNPLEFLQRVSNGDVCFYAEKNDMWYPVELYVGTEMFLQHKVESFIKIADVTYYERYSVIASTKDKFTIIPSENLTINWTEGNFNFKPTSTLHEVYNDVKFLMALKNNSEINIGGMPLNYNNPRLKGQLEDDLHTISDLYEIFKVANITLETRFSDFDDEDYKYLFKLLRIYRGEDKVERAQLYTLDLKLQGKIYPLLICKENDEVIFTNRVYESRYQGFVVANGTEQYKVPMFCGLRGNILGNLYKYDYADLNYQIDNSEINAFTIGTLNFAAIGLIEAYDVNFDRGLLYLAMSIYKKILVISPDAFYIKVNEWQIKKRLGTLEELDRNELRRAKTKETDVQFLCAICLLLDDKDAAKEYFDKIGIKEKEEFLSYPICKYLNV